MAMKTSALSSTKILENLPQSIFTADLEGIVTYWNKAGEDIFGYTREEMLNSSIEKVYSEKDKKRLQRNLKRLKQGKEVKGQWNCVKKDDSTVWLDVCAKALFNKEGEPYAVVASVSDISELKKAEQEVRKTEAKMEAVFKSTIDGIVTIGKGGIIRRFNEAASIIFGYTESEVQGKNYRLLLPQKDRKNPDDYFKKIFQTDKAEFAGARKELTGRKKDGTIFPMELSVSKARWDENEIFTAFISDISERRRLEQEILWISEEERRNIGQNMHDGLGQLLTGIGLITQTLARRLDNLGKPEAEEVQEIADMIKEADEQARALAHGLVHVGVEEDGLQASLKRLGKQVKKLFDINCEYDIDYDVIVNNSVTSLNLYRIAQEAINNAYKHGEADKIKIVLKQVDDCIKLIIENNGIPFSLSDKDKDKEGMGINIMRYRADMVYGDLEFNKTEDENTRVICTVPVDHCEV